MPYMLIRHTVADYEKWKPVFDAHQAVRKPAGGKGGQLFRNADNPNETLVLFEWDNLQNARKFTLSEDLHKTIEKAGSSPSRRSSSSTR